MIQRLWLDVAKRGNAANKNKIEDGEDEPALEDR